MVSSSNEVRQKFKLVITCVSAALNALTAGAVITFPIMSPALATRMKFTQPQLTSIVLAGFVGQCPLAPIVGKIVDYFGPWFCSLIAAVSFSLAFGLCAWELDTAPETILSPTAASFHRFVSYFALAGLGTTFSYFSAVFTATKNFPEWMGMASASSMVLYCLSPLFLSLFASHFFMDPVAGLDLSHYFVFLALLCGIVNSLGTFALNTPKLDVVDIVEPQPEEGLEPGTESDDETTAFIPGAVNIEGVTPVEKPKEGSVLDLLKDPYFWILLISLSLIVGSCEMVMSNIGTIMLALPPVSLSQSGATSAVVPTPDASIATQVQLIAICNTASRVIAGPLADYTSPAAVYFNGTFGINRKRRGSRILYLSVASLVLAISFVWVEVGVRSQSAIWALSVGAGLVNGCLFTVLPGILSSIWGLKNLGRNFGVTIYSGFIGTPVISLLYSFVSESHSAGGICRGVDCWRTTFWVTAGAAVLSFLLTMVLWRQWRHRI